MTNRIPDFLVLSIYPTTHGFAFVLFEGPESPFDWGVKQIRGPKKNSKALKEVARLLERYQPDALVIEDINENGSRRSGRIRKLYRLLISAALSQDIDVCRYPHSVVRACFSQLGAKTKYEIAKAVSTYIPAFAHRMPPLRKIWMSEDPRQSLFDAAALGLTYFVHHIPSPYLGEDISQ